MTFPDPDLVEEAPSLATEHGYWELDAIVAELSEIRRSWRAAQTHHAEYGSEGFPSRGDLGKIMEALCGALFPLRLGPNFVRLHNEDVFVAQTLQTALSRLYSVSLSLAL